MLERTTQPMTDAVIKRPMTLIEKLEQELANNSHKFNNWDNGFKAAINIVKQHQVESGWVSVKTPPPKRGNYLVYTNDYRMFDCRYSDGWHKNTIGYKDILYWKPIQPPSEVQDETQ